MNKVASLTLASGPAGRTRRARTLLVIVCLGTALRAFRLGHQSFWTDEILTVDAANIGLGDLVARPQDYNVMPLYYLIVNAALQVSRQEAWLRLPSVLAGGLTVALFYQALRGRFGDGVAWKGAFLMAISPLHIWYSQETRAYALALMLSMGAMVAAQWLGESRHDRGAQILLVLLTVSAVYAHFIALPLVLLVLIHLLSRAPVPSRGERLALCAAILVLLWPAAGRLVLLLGHGPVAPGAEPLTKAALPLQLGYLLWAFVSGFSLGPTLTELHGPDRLHLASVWLPLILPILGLVVVLLGLGVRHLSREGRRPFALVLLALLVPTASTLAAAALTPFPFQVRYCLLALPAFFLLLALALDGSRARGWARAALLALTAVSLASLANYFFEPRYQRDDNRSAGRYLASHARGGDLVLTGFSGAHDLEYYLAGARPLRVVPVGIARGADPVQTENSLARLVAGHDQFWLFLSRSFDDDPEARIPATCDRRWRRGLQLSWGNVQLIRYVSEGPSRGREEEGKATPPNPGPP